MLVAVEGCCHGSLDRIYETPEVKKAHLLIICGDFQSLRNQADLQCISVPDKYKQMGDFQDYYEGKKTAPIMTIFVGGNHEASNYLEELKYGGFVAPNIYYLGRSGVVWYDGLRIVGWSGIYYNRDFMMLRRDMPLPYDRWTLKSIYHYRKDDYIKLRLLQPCSSAVVVSHDWPEGVYKYDRSTLLRKKPFFKKDMDRGELGSPANWDLLEYLKPSYWFAAHLHVKFKVEIDWSEPPTKRNRDEISLDLDTLDSDTSDLNNEAGETTFVALDKCLPKRNYMELVDLPTDAGHPGLYLDREYLAIRKVVDLHTRELDRLSYDEVLNPHEFSHSIHEEIVELRKHYDTLPDDYFEPAKFQRTAPPDATVLVSYKNPQTTEFEHRFN